MEPEGEERYGNGKHLTPVKETEMDAQIEVGGGGGGGGGGELSQRAVHATWDAGEEGGECPPTHEYKVVGTACECRSSVVSDLHALLS